MSRTQIGWGLLVGLLLANSFTPGRAQEVSPERNAESETISSPRLAALARELGAGNRGTLEAFWAEVKGKAPLVEPIPGDDGNRLVTFVWRGDAQTRRVALLGGRPAADLAKPLVRLPESDLWYRSETHPVEARFGYRFRVNGPETLPERPVDVEKLGGQSPPSPDPLSERSFDGGSYVELPGAPAQPWIVRQPTVPRGNLSHQSFKSEILKAEDSLTVYTPPVYNPNGPRCWLLIAFDGGFPMMEVTLDNLLAAGKIPPMVVVGVENISPESRRRDLGCSDPFARFLVTELVPWARKRYRVHAGPAHTIVGGISRGGLMAVYCGLKHANVFGKVLAQSGVYMAGPGIATPEPIWVEEAPGLLARQFVTNPRQPVTFYLEIGRYETNYRASWLYENRRLRDVLEAKGYRVIYSEYVGGHDYVCWRGSFADAMTALTAKRKR